MTYPIGCSTNWASAGVALATQTLRMHALTIRLVDKNMWNSLGFDMKLIVFAHQSALTFNQAVKTPRCAVIWLSFTTVPESFWYRSTSATTSLVQPATESVLQ
ncbi:MAG: hypothetical protein ACRYGK_14240 [Janthinobacterium lividum]